MSNPFAPKQHEPYPEDQLKPNPHLDRITKNEPLVKANPFKPTERIPWAGNRHGRYKVEGDKVFDGCRHMHLDTQKTINHLNELLCSAISEYKQVVFELAQHKDSKFYEALMLRHQQLIEEYEKI